MIIMDVHEVDERQRPGIVRFPGNVTPENITLCINGQLVKEALLVYRIIINERELSKMVSLELDMLEVASLELLDWKLKVDDAMACEPREID